jgi:hypothetical protein
MQVVLDVTRESPVICHKGRWFHVILYDDGSARVEEVEPR